MIKRSLGLHPFSPWKRPFFETLYETGGRVFNHISKLRYASSLKALFRYLEIWSLFLRDAMSRILHWTGSFSPRKEEASTVNYFRVKLRLATTCRKDREVLWPQAYGVRHGWSIRATTRLRRQEMPCNTPTIRFQLLSCYDDVVSCGRASILWSQVPMQKLNRRSRVVVVFSVIRSICS